MRLIALFVLVASSGVMSAADVAVAEVAYADGATALRGWVARPVDDGPHPGVLVVPEWWGLNDYTKRRARELAERGIVAFAVDMYGDGRVTTDAAEAGALAGPLRKDRAAMRARAKAGLVALRSQPGVDPARLAAIGFCFGGTTVLELARAGEPLVAVVSFHGGLATDLPAAPGAITARVLVLHGGADPHVAPAEVAAFFAEMNAAKAAWRFAAYGGAVHAFTNPAAGADPSTGVAYDADAERRSFAAMWELFAETITKP